jgi:hypothetical protein
MRTNICLILAFYIGLTVTLAQSTDYKYSREITGVSEAWHKLELPVDIFEKLNTNFSDLRIFGINNHSHDTTEVPYLLKIHAGKSKTQAANIKIINRSSNAMGYYFTFQVNEEILANQIKLNFVEENFDWLLQLEGSHDGKDWFRILKDYRIISIKNEFTNYNFNTVKFPDSRYRYFRVNINSNKQPELINAQIIKEDVLSPLYNTYQAKSISIETDKKLKHTIVELTFPKPVPVSALKLNIESKNDYYRPIHIQYLMDSVATEKGWVLNYAQMHSATLSSAENNFFSFSSKQSSIIKIIIRNQDNEALKIHSVEAFGYKHELIVRFPIADQYFLFYGNSNVVLPTYDLIQFENNIPKNVTPVTLHEEQLLQSQKTDYTLKWYEHKGLMWVIIGLIILLLGYFSLRMMQK